MTTPAVIVTYDLALAVALWMIIGVVLARGRLAALPVTPMAPPTGSLERSAS